MITPKEINEQCAKWWKEVLISTMDAADYFPKEITRIGKVTSKDILHKLSDYKQAIEHLRSHSKEYKKYGYQVSITERQFDKIGKQPVPEKIIIETLDDYLRLTGKEKEFQTFLKNYACIQDTLPRLYEWVKANPIRLIEHDTWPDTLRVCIYFLENPVPNLYIRQLPIAVHTKYILENKSLIQSLLEFLIPQHLQPDETRFERRFNLCYAEPLIRVRFLDPTLSPMEHVTDLSLTHSEFKAFQVPCQAIFVAENLMNFLTLPFLTKTIAIWSGGGFSVSYLKDIPWIQAKPFFYWGDLDAQGFQILHQFRTYFPHTTAVLMDEETLLHFHSGAGQPSLPHHLPHLTDNEQMLYHYLQQNNIRLEQEKITQTYAEERIKKLLPL